MKESPEKSVTDKKETRNEYVTGDFHNNDRKRFCPDCGSNLIPCSGCFYCPICGWTSCTD